ncbi:hypothetical protein [Sinomicrobium oceani]|nr:hypothetical protein [Sinomicrobium oceani]
MNTPTFLIRSDSGAAYCNHFISSRSWRFWRFGKTTYHPLKIEHPSL